MDIEAEEARSVQSFVLKPVLFLIRAEKQHDGAVQIQVTSQMLAEVHLKKQKVIIGNMLDLINA